jgi:hypothetical protein
VHPVVKAEVLAKSMQVSVLLLGILESNQEVTNSDLSVDVAGNVVLRNDKLEIENLWLSFTGSSILCNSHISKLHTLNKVCSQEAGRIMCAKTNGGFKFRNTHVSLKLKL